MKKERGDKLLHIYMNNHAHRAQFPDIICTDCVNNMNMTMEHRRQTDEDHSRRWLQ